MRNSLLIILAFMVLPWTCEGKENAANREDARAGVVTAHSRGLHGYIGYSASRPPDRANYSAGMGFYAAVWPLIDKPIARFQIGLPSAWITPDNSDNKDTPLAPIGTLARDNWPERGPTWSSVFQTVEGGLGYWARNRFRYGPPKFSMNATPQCYDYEVGSPGWSFFYSSTALPDNRLGIAQLSNRLLIPPDALPFEGNPNGKFLGYTYMALPFTEPTTGDPPTGDQAWTCFLSAANFKGPMAYYIPETWSKIGKLFNYPFIYGRGLDARPGRMGGGAMEINTVPRFEAKDAKGVVYSKLPKLQFPVDDRGRTLLVEDVTYYSKAALYDAFKAWRDGGPACSGRFDEKGAWKSTLRTRTPRFDQAGKRITGVDKIFNTKVFESNVWGLEWHDGTTNANGYFPQYFKHVGDERVAVSAADVPAETQLLNKEFRLASRGKPYTSPAAGAWSKPGPKRGPFTVDLTDGSTVTYSWYRFVDQPSFQQYDWSDEKKAKLQSFVEKIHASWPIDRNYMAPPSSGELATLDPALLVTPPKGLEVGYVPIVTRQEAASKIIEPPKVEAGSKDSRQPLTFCNPLNIEYRFTPGKPSRRMAADPVIVLFRDTYFLFSTGSSEYWHSSDLVNWILIPEEKSELPDHPTAPAVTVVGDEVYFIPSSRGSGLFYKSTDPKSGKWELAKKSIPTWDPALFCDDDGRAYYYWGCSNNAPIQGVELDKSSMKPKGEIKDFFKGNKEEHGWERRGDKHELPNPAWIEGPWMTKHGDTYYLQYAAPGTEFKSYADGVYTSKNPLGPFKYEPYSPFSHKPGGFIGGAGHGATFQDKYGNYWRVTTMVISVLDMFERRVGIFPAGFDKDGVMYTNTLLGDFPQIMPKEKRGPFANNLAEWMLLSYGKKADASSSIPEHGTKLAFDENVKTWWCAKTSNKGEWLKVDLSKMYILNAVQVNFAEHEANLLGREEPIYQKYLLEYSNDNQNWKKLVDKSNNAKDVPHDYIQLPQPVKARFIKLTNIYTPGEGPFAVRDLRIFGNGLAKAPSQVHGLTVHRDTRDRRTANITWNKSKDAVGFVIRYGITPEKLYNQYQVMGKTELKINSLNRDVGYYFSIDVFNENGYTKGTNIIESK